MLKAIIFDMDGVIAHTNPTHMVAFKIFFSKRNLFPSDDELIEHMYGKNNSYIFSHFFNRTITGSELTKFEEEKEELFRNIYANDVKALNGFEHFVSFLDSLKLKKGVATSAPRSNMELILGKLNIRDQFESILTSEDVELHKPHPEVYLKSAQALGILPNECLVFEDSKSGVQAAINAQMNVVGVLSSHSQDALPKCNMYIEDFTSPQLYDYIRSISK